MLSLFASPFCGWDKRSDPYNQISGAGVAARHQIERSLDEEHRGLRPMNFPDFITKNARRCRALDLNKDLTELRQVLQAEEYTFLLYSINLNIICARFASQPKMTNTNIRTGPTATPCQQPAHTQKYSLSCPLLEYYRRFFCLHGPLRLGEGMRKSGLEIVSILRRIGREKGLGLTPKG